MSLHLFYIMILYLYSWMNGNGHGDIALETCAALFDHLFWIVTVSEAFMLPVFLYCFFLQIRGKTRFAKGMAFTNGLMSESMILFLAITWIAGRNALSQFLGCYNERSAHGKDISDH